MSPPQSHLHIITVSVGTNRNKNKAPVSKLKALNLCKLYFTQSKVHKWNCKMVQKLKFK